MNYRPFYSIIRRYVNKLITRERFVFDWKMEQKEQGLTGPKNTPETGQDVKFRSRLRRKFLRCLRRNRRKDGRK